MRYYDIKMVNLKTGKEIMPSSLGGERLSSFTKSGRYNPAALNIEFDIPFFNTNSPDHNAFLRVWGLGLKDISNALDLTPDQDPTVGVVISAGMSKGLPLANPKQQGILLTGAIFQAWGNWVDTNQTLDFTFIPAPGSLDVPVNYMFNMPKGTKMADAIAQTLKTVLPQAKQTIKISDNLVLNHDEAGTYQTLEQFSTYIEGLSKSIVKTKNYIGVQIAATKDSVLVSDDTVKAEDNAIKKIEFQDLIGQPTWIGFNVIQAKVVLRGDLALQDYVQLPKGMASQTQQTYARFRDKTTFTGKYQIQSIHHYGNFRQPDAASWNTTLEMIAIQESSATDTPTPPSETQPPRPGEQVKRPRVTVDRPSIVDDGGINDANIPT